MVKPLRDMVVIKRDVPEEKSAGGIVLTATKPEALDRGVVVAVGPGTYIGKEFVPTTVRVGDRVIFAKRSGEEFKDGEETHIAMAEMCIMGIVES